MKCKICGEEATVSLKSHNAGFCDNHFLQYFRRQIERGIESQQLFSGDDKILVALSGGKDSLALMLELHELGYQVTGLFIDLAIPESSEIAGGYVRSFCESHELPLLICELEKEGLSIPEVRKKIRRPICSVCGKIKRYYFNRTAMENGFDVLATGHNLDDESSRLFSNVLRWDNAYLSGQGPALSASGSFVRKVKPLWRLSEFETACYAFIRKIPHHVGSCPYSKGASFTSLKLIMHQLENQMPGKKLDFYQSFLKNGRKYFTEASLENPLRKCDSCGYPTSSDDICGVCRIRALLREKSGMSN